MYNLSNSQKVGLSFQIIKLYYTISMNTFAIDTYKTINKLKQKGYTEKQAEGFIEALTESDLITKTYFDSRLNELELRFTAKLYNVLLIHGLAMVATIVTVAKVL